MLEELVKEGRKLEKTIDPHIKKDKEYFAYKEIKEKKLYVMDSSASEP
jgi:hypothetical protein